MENAKLAGNARISVMLSVAEETKSRNWKILLVVMLHKFKITTRIL